MLERVKGIEPSSQAWEARILPLDHTRANRNRTQFLPYALSACNPKFEKSMTGSNPSRPACESPKWVIAGSGDPAGGYESAQALFRFGTRFVKRGQKTAN